MNGSARWILVAGLAGAVVAGVLSLVIYAVARASGAFPIRITLESPDGHLEVGRARITVRSTAASGASLVVAMGAATFLAVWWGRNAMKGRRARGLVPGE